MGSGNEEDSYLDLSRVRFSEHTADLIRCLRKGRELTVIGLSEVPAYERLSDPGLPCNLAFNCTLSRFVDQLKA